MGRWKIRLNHANAWLYEKTGGRVGGSFGGHRVLLLTTTGRKTGVPRRTPVQYEEIDGEIAIVAAGGGSPRPPHWFLNVEADPVVTVQTGSRTWRARAVVVPAEQRARVWSDLIERNQYLPRIAERAGRELPVVWLVPSAATVRADRP